MFAGRSLTSLQLEISPLDTRDEEFTSLPAPSLGAVGLTGPDVVLVLSERWQIAQKLHAVTEQFGFGSMKDEEVWTTEYETRAEAIAAIDAWIHFYRTERPHQSLGYLTPTEYRSAELDSTCARNAA